MVNQRYLGLNTLLTLQLLIKDFKSLQLNLLILRRGLFVDGNWERKGRSMETGPQWILFTHHVLQTDANIQLPNPPLILPLCLPWICFWLCPLLIYFFNFKTYLFWTRHWIHSWRSSSEQSGKDVLSFRTFGLVCHSIISLHLDHSTILRASLGQVLCLSQWYISRPWHFMDAQWNGQSRILDHLDN